jgi:hypothetical protein
MSRAAAARLLRRAGVTLLVINALDLTTSILPTFIDQTPTPRRGTLALVAQLALVLPLAVAAAGSARPLVRRWARLPIPLVPRAILSALVLLQLGHMALRMEIYPFTSVAMFSSLATPPADGTYTASSYVIDRGEGVELLRMMREGNPLFARHFAWDYKTGWLMQMYKGSPGADAVLATVLATTPPRLARVTYQQRDGRIRSIVTSRCQSR